jgi:hypothetical protein
MGGAYREVREHGQGARTPLPDFFNTLLVYHEKTVNCPRSSARMVGGSIPGNSPSGRVIFLDLFSKRISGFQEQSGRDYTRIMVQSIRCCSQNKPIVQVLKGFGPLLVIYGLLLVCKQEFIQNSRNLSIIFCTSIVSNKGCLVFVCSNPPQYYLRTEKPASDKSHNHYDNTDNDV